MAKGRRILLVDDEAEFLFSVSVGLRKNGYRVDAAESGDEALRKVLDARDEGDPHDLLITDIRMPGMSGLNLIDAVKSLGGTTSFFAMTCFPDDELIGELRSRGCDEVIEKPFPPDELVSRIEGILGPKRLEAS